MGFMPVEISYPYIPIPRHHWPRGHESIHSSCLPSSDLIKGHIMGLYLLKGYIDTWLMSCSGTQVGIEIKYVHSFSFTIVVRSIKISTKII